jgi:hypothetical protein
MSKETKFKTFLDAHKDNLKMAIALGNLDEAIKVIFEAGFEKGWEEGMTDAVQAPDLEY